MGQEQPDTSMADVSHAHDDIGLSDVFLTERITDVNDTNLEKDVVRSILFYVIYCPRVGFQVYSYDDREFVN